MQTLLVTADALHADHLGQFGYERDTMPVLDRLASDGRWYEAAFANGAHTKLSIPSFLTGRYNGFAALQEGPTVASILQEAEVATAGFHSNVVLSHDFDVPVGFDHYVDFTEQPERWQEGGPDGSGAEAGREGTVNDSADHGPLTTAAAGIVKRLRPYFDEGGLATEVRKWLVPDSALHEPTPYADAAVVTDHVLDWVTDHAEQDFFVWAHYMDPHRPYGYSQDEYAYVDRDLADGVVDELMARAGVSPEELTDDEVGLLVDLYDSDLRYLDAELGRLFDGLADAGVWEDLDLLFTSDHGEEFGEHGEFYHRNAPYDELIHVPLVHRRADGAGAGEAVSGQRELIDLLPTICNRHDLPSPEDLPGHLLDDDTERTVVAAALRGELLLAAREPTTKYIERPDAEEVYDLGTDPDEQEPLPDPDAATVRRLSRAIPAPLRGVEADAEGLVAEEDATDETRERLADLGYLE